MCDVTMIDDPTLAISHDTPEHVERRFMVFFAQTLTPSGEAHTVRIERPAIREETPLQIDVKRQDHE